MIELTSSGSARGRANRLETFLKRSLFLCSVALLAPFAGSGGVQAGVVGQWHFDEAPGAVIAGDAVGENPGSLGGDAAFVAGGISGNAVSMSKGGAGYVSMGDIFPMTSGDFSLVFWIKTTDTANDSYVLSRHLSGGRNGYFVAINPGAGGALGLTTKASLYLSTPGDYTSLSQAPVSTTTVTDGAWHQVAAVYHAGGVAEIFVDGGGVEDSGTAHAIIDAATAKFVVGGLTYSGTPGGVFTGMVDELQVYGYALSQAEIETLYADTGKLIFRDGFEEESP